MLINNNSDDILFLNAKEINKKLWDRTINSVFNGNLFFTYDFMNIATSKKWFALTDKSFSWILPLPLNKKLLSYKISATKFFPYTTLLYKDSSHLNYCWKKTLKLITKKIKNNECNKLLIKYLPGERLKKTSTYNLETDLPYALDLLHRQQQFNFYLKEASKQSLYANTHIPLKGILLFAMENTTYFTSTLKQLLNITHKTNRLFPIGVYDKNSKLIFLIIAALFRTRILILETIHKKDISTVDKSLAKFTALNKLLESYHHLNLTLEIPHYLNFFSDLPFESIMKKIPLYTLKTN